METHAFTNGMRISCYRSNAWAEVPHMSARCITDRSSYWCQDSCLAKIQICRLAGMIFQFHGVLDKYFSALDGITTLCLLRIPHYSRQAHPCISRNVFEWLKIRLVHGCSWMTSNLLGCVSVTLLTCICIPGVSGSWRVWIRRDRLVQVLYTRVCTQLCMCSIVVWAAFVVNELDNYWCCACWVTQEGCDNVTTLTARPYVYWWNRVNAKTTPNISSSILLYQLSVLARLLDA